ncbi:MAG: TetR family transcriptional regulator [Pseudomonadota bacterium]
MRSAAQKTISQQRARSAEDKDLRRAHLIEAATRLFADADFDAVTIARVAEAAGVAKGTAYIYFATKEALFLELVRAELVLWQQDLVAILRRLRSRQPLEAVPAAIARSVAQRPTLQRLLILLHTVIEPKIDEESARDFKLFLRDLLAEASEPLCGKLPGLSAEQATTLMLQLHALVISLAQLSNPPPVMVRVMANNPELQFFRIDFESFLRETLTTLVRGTLSTPTARD